MNRRPRPEQDPGRGGYVALLALSFAFGLAIFGGALAVGVQNYLRTASAEQRRVLDRISLESVAAKVLGEIAAGEGHPLHPTRLPDVEINGRRISVTVSVPDGKHEPAVDDPRAIRDILRRAGVAPAANGGDAASLAAFFISQGVTAAQEDCLRRELTYGRAPEEFQAGAHSAAGPGSEPPEGLRKVSTGDQIDLRVALPSPDGEQVLWVRARFGGVGPAWRLHDYRLLSIRAPACGVQPGH